MPVFDYKCHDCGDVVEQLELLGKEYSAPICPICKYNMRRLLGTFSVRGFTRVPRNHLPKSKYPDVGEWDYSDKLE